MIYQKFVSLFPFAHIADLFDAGQLSSFLWDSTIIESAEAPFAVNANILNSVWSADGALWFAIEPFDDAFSVEDVPALELYWYSSLQTDAAFGVEVAGGDFEGFPFGAGDDLLHADDLMR